MIFCQMEKRRKVRLHDRIQDKSIASNITMRNHVGEDFAITITVFYMKFAGFWLAANQGEQFRRRIAFYYTAGAVSFAVYVESTDFYFSLDNLSEAIYTLCNVMTLVLVLCKMFILSMRRTKFMNLIQHMQDHFWNLNYDPHESEIVQECRKKCTFFVCSFTFFAQGTVCCYIITPLVENIGRNESDRVLPFNMWINLPFSKTPYYEITFVVQVLSLYTVGICYFCFDNLLCIMNLHTAGQFRILQYRLAKSFHEKESNIHDYSNMGSYPMNKLNASYNTFKRCIQNHQILIKYCHDLNHVFTFIVLGQVLLFSVLICLVGYQILLLDAAPTRRAMFIFYITGTLLQLMMFTYSCHLLTEQSKEVAEAAYSSSWISIPLNKTGRIFRKDLLLVIMRARRPCSLSAGGFFPISLETYTAVMSTAMSYFTLLKQRTVGVESA